MGIIRSDVVSTPYGADVSNSYMAIAGNSIEIRREIHRGDPMAGDDTPPDSVDFTMTFTADVWYSLDARNARKRAIHSKSYRVSFSEMPADKNIYAIAYDHIKSTLTEGTYTDA